MPLGRLLPLLAVVLFSFPIWGGRGLSVAARGSPASRASGRDEAIPSRGASPDIERGVFEAIASRGEATVHLLLRGRRPLPVGATRHRERLFTSEVAGAQRAVREMLPSHGVRILRAHSHAFGLVANVDAGGLEALSRIPYVERVYLDGTVEAMLAEGVPLIGGDVLHGMGYSGAGMSIAVLDTGIDYTHPALGGCLGPSCKVLGGHDFVNNDTDPMDDGGHGTSIAGIAAADSVDIRGVAYGANLVGLKVLASNGVGTFSAVDAALNWVLANRTTYSIKVVNMSLGDSGQYDDPNEPLCTASTTANLIQSLVNVGVAVTVATGNNGYDHGISFPACVAEATAVGAVYDADHGSVTWCTDRNCTAILCTDTTTGSGVYMCRGNAGSLLDLLASSWKATTTQLGGGTRDLGGTSSAAAYAAGAFALMFHAKPGESVGAIEGNLRANGVPTVNSDSGLSYPRIDLSAALSNYDNDLDLVPIASDNCPYAYNPGQADGDLDTVGDACDNCPVIANEYQENGDGDPAGTACDCDDAQAAVYPGAPEVCDGLNNDCNHPVWPSLLVETDDDLDGQAECGGDCDDSNPLIRSGIPESCDGLDNDCDTVVPAEESDTDMDGWRICAGDCDDVHDAAHPGGTEVCDGLDNDCDGSLPSGEADADRDGWRICEGDCDDTRRLVYPGAPEICDGHDSDCDGYKPVAEIDADGDGVLVCGGDCDDDARLVYPGAPEICDGRNNDCGHPAWPSLAVESDDDLDGYAECAGDCDDGDDQIHPTAQDRCDDIDNDCDGNVDPNYPLIVEVPSYASVLDPNGEPTDWFGSSLALGGDLTGDGVPDLLVGAPGYPAGLAARGQVLVVSGATRSVALRMKDPESGTSAQLGYAVAQGGDVDGDGRGDILASAPFQDLPGGTQQGRVLLFSSLDGTKLWTYGDPYSASSARLGQSLASITDVNDDGVRDVLAGAPGDCTGGLGCSGAVWTLDGKTGLPLGFVTDPSDETQERFGSSVAPIGDLNGDGKEDFAVGAPNRDVGGFINSGAVLIFAGGTGAFLNQYTDTTLAARDQLGSAMAAVPDLNGDGTIDVIVGAPGHMTMAGLDVGQALVLSGEDGTVILRLLDPNGQAGDRFGTAVASLGDIDRDRVPELLVGSPFKETAEGTDAGAVLLFSGRTGELLATITHPTGDADDNFGAAAAGLPPLDGDGIPDFVVGVPLDEGAIGDDAGSLQFFSPHAPGDCDGDGIPNDLDTCTDADLDGYGSTIFTPPSTCDPDCDDERDAVHPGAAEICDGLDTDCDGYKPPGEDDADADGVPVCAGDCDDASAAVWPGAPQVCDDLNNDCDDPSWPTVSPDECFDITNVVADSVAAFVVLDWDIPPGGATLYRIYRGGIGDLLAGRNGGFCFTTSTTNSAVFADTPGEGGLSYYVVAGVKGNLEGSRGRTSAGVEREHSDVCP